MRPRAAALIAVAALLMSRSAPGQTVTPVGVQILPVQGQVYMIVGPGGNVTVQVGAEGLLVVDSQTAGASSWIVEAIRAITPRPIRYIVNTSADEDHTGGNENLSKSGRYFGGGNERPGQSYTAGAGASIFAHEAVLNRMTATVASGRWPTDTFFVRKKDLYLNGEAIHLIHQPAAHTDGDVMVMFRRSDVLSTGDVFTPDRYPMIDLEKGGSITGLLAGLNAILDLTVPADKQEGGTMVVPGHGRLCDESDVSEYRDMVTMVRDRIQDMVKKKMTLAQVKAARPTLDFDVVYATAAHTGEMFTEAVYHSLTRPAAKTGGTQ